MTHPAGADRPRRHNPHFNCTWALTGLRGAEVRVTGELDIATGPQLADALVAAVEAAPLVLLRMEDVTFMDLTGLRVLLEASDAASARGGKLVVAHLGLELTALLELLDVRSRLNAVAPAGASLREATPVERSSLRRERNPVNAAILAARVMAVPDRRLWLEAEDGIIRRAWAPPEADGAASAGRPVELYVDHGGAVNGWRDVLSGLAINQRRLAPGRSPRTSEPMTCQGECGRTWHAPAAEQLQEHGEHCLTCAGPLAQG